MNGIMVGTDAETFLQNSSGKIISAVGLLGGDKKNPRVTKHGAVQEDGVLAEFNTHPASNADELVVNIRSVQRDLKEILDGKGLSSIVRASAVLDDDQLQDPRARIAGCYPDFNGWTFDMNEKPVLAKTNLRTASAHIHISWADFDEDIVQQYQVACAMDLFHSVPGVLLDADTCTLPTDLCL